jgi:hypothetical protein
MPRRCQPEVRPSSALENARQSERRGAYNAFLSLQPSLSLSFAGLRCAHPQLYAVPRRVSQRVRAVLQYSSQSPALLRTPRAPEGRAKHKRRVFSPRRRLFFSDRRRDATDVPPHPQAHLGQQVQGRQRGGGPVLRLLPALRREAGAFFRVGRPPATRHEKHSCACSSVPRSRPPSPPRAPAPPLLQVSTLKLLPSRTISRLYGAVNNFTL